MDFTGRCSVLNEGHEHWKVSNVTCILHDKLNLLENLENISEEKLGAVGGYLV